MMSKLDKSVWDYFETYKSAAPRNLEELKQFEVKCRANNYPQVADFLENFRLNIEYHMTKEWAVDKNDKWRVCDRGHIIEDQEYCDECLKNDYSKQIEEADDGAL